MNTEWSASKSEEVEITGDWLAGFIDGEGTFLIQAHRTLRGVEYYNTQFAIGLRFDDIDTLLKIQSFLDCGTISIQSQASLERAQAKQPGINRAVRFEIQSRRDCQKLLRLLGQHPLRSRKQRDLEIWARAVNELAKSSGARDKEYVAYLRRRISKVRQYDSAQGPIITGLIRVPQMNFEDYMKEIENSGANNEGS